jgi:hypothetical protein
MRPGWTSISGRPRSTRTCAAGADRGRVKAAMVNASHKKEIDADSDLDRQTSSEAMLRPPAASFEWSC